MTHPLENELASHDNFREQKPAPIEEPSHINLIGIVGAGALGTAVVVGMIKGRNQLGPLVERLSSLTGKATELDVPGGRVLTGLWHDVEGTTASSVADLGDQAGGHLSSAITQRDLAVETLPETIIDGAAGAKFSHGHDVAESADLVAHDKPVISTDSIRTALAQDERYVRFNTPKPGAPDLSAGTFFSIKDPADWDSKLENLLGKLEQHRANPSVLTDDQIRDFWGIKAEELGRKVYGTMHDDKLRESVDTLLRDFRLRPDALKDDPNAAVQVIVERHDSIKRDDNAVQNLIGKAQPREGATPTLSGIPFIEFKNEAFRKFVGVRRDIQYAMDPAGYMAEMSEAYSMNPSWRENMFDGLEERLQPINVAERLRGIVKDYDTIAEQAKLLKDAKEDQEHAENLGDQARAMLFRLDQYISHEQIKNGRLVEGPLDPEHFDLPAPRSEQ